LEFQPVAAEVVCAILSIDPGVAGPDQFFVYGPAVDVDGGNRSPVSVDVDGLNFHRVTVREL